MGLGKVEQFGLIKKSSFFAVKKLTLSLLLKKY
uniref:Uncharacterized protein n=1 Tax=Tetranychus urticae TaxID=32264 RepID=T1KQL4_TETUR